MSGDSQKLLELAERVEKAEGPNFALEMEIDRAINPERPAGLRYPNYTASLDSALTLVPEGMEKSLSDLYGVARAEVGLNCTDGPQYGEHKGAILCLALCAAALRARAAIIDSHQMQVCEGQEDRDDGIS